ncbi:chemotaxis protein CheA [Poseidonocella sedimentorum]|uniref:Chemotaxis protein CheA n=1 Tax=Poseidonocella sedimentorum TaxID=871652 RepID=A0A1I6EHH0_9RHOB|nr:chemotaxis protein CheA [Poseidonocella sedimentorum]SFR17173.1 two-component system, chemotaxis family, sensor kinase CheA [Poseidonocella sedimentorum]
MSGTNDIRDTFFLECEDLLEALEEGLQEANEHIADGAIDSETINAVFRAVHSIKGGAGAFALNDLVHFAHTFETVLDEVRSGALMPDAEIMDLFFRSSDRLVDLVAAARDETPVDLSENQVLEAELKKYAPDEEEEVEADDFQPMGLDFSMDLPDLDFDDDAPAPAKAIGFEISVRPHDAFYACGNDIVHLLRGLSELGETTVAVETDAHADFDEIAPEKSAATWSVRLITEESEHVIYDVFDFVDGICDLKVDPIHEETMEDEPISDEAADPVELEVVQKIESPAEEAPVEVKKSEVPAPVKAAPVEAAKPDAGGKAAAKTSRATIRVDLERVDRLINVVGELVINQAMLSQCVKEAGITGSTDISSGLDEFKQLSREIQESVMAIRAQPVKSLFQRMSRIVREVASATGKRVRLVTTGESTEVDKTVIERLADPLTHMIRNAIDHGLESSDARTSAGKVETGTVTLSAAHRSGRVLIEISDDGAGINRERVLQIAIDKGLVDANAELSDTEIDNLIFAPGFSTAGEISDLSGRGVGMDVVKSSIQSLGGKVSINSIPGKGSTFTISLPLTLAVMEGMVVEVTGQTMIVPLTAIVETLRPEDKDIHHLGTGEQVVSVRGVFIPIFDLGSILGYRTTKSYSSNQVLLLISTDEEQTYALTVDSIFDQRQVVIKGLSENYGELPGIAAATILGDGRIALIIDTDGIYGMNSHSAIKTQQPWIGAA